MSSNKISSMLVECREWPDTRNGQTYHAVQISINGQWLGNSDRAYGYHDQYLETALEWLKAQGIVSDDVRTIWDWSRVEGFALYTVKYQTAKRELYDFNVLPERVAKFASVSA